MEYSFISEKSNSVNEKRMSKFDVVNSASLNPDTSFQNKMSFKNEEVQSNLIKCDYDYNNPTNFPDITFSDKNKLKIEETPVKNEAGDEIKQENPVNCFLTPETVPVGIMASMVKDQIKRIKESNKPFLPFQPLEKGNIPSINLNELPSKRALNKLQDFYSFYLDIKGIKIKADNLIKTERGEIQIKNEMIVIKNGKYKRKKRPAYIN